MNKTPLLSEKLENLREYIEANKDVDDYLAKAQGFSDARIEAAEKSELKAWRVASAAGGGLGLSLLALVMLFPLKETPPPEVLVMEKTTGMVRPLLRVEEIQISADEIWTRKWTTEFVLARESYTYATAKKNYDTAAAFMCPQLQAQWAAYWDTENKKSPFAVYGNHTTVETEILEIVPQKDSNLLTVRFSQTYKSTTNATPVTLYKVATMTYKKVNAPEEEEIKLINPMGFQICDYRTDPIIGGAPTAAAAVNPLSAPQPAPQPAQPAMALQAPKLEGGSL